MANNFSFVTENIINKFSQDIVNVTHLLSEYIENIPIARFSAPINFTVKYNMNNFELTISSTGHKDSKFLLSSEYSLYCEAVFSRAFDNYFGMTNKAVSKITKNEPPIDNVLDKSKDIYITYEFSIDTIIKANKEFSN